MTRHVAASLNLDLQRFADILNAGPMASDVSRPKIDKLSRRDFLRQAGLSDVLKNARLLAEEARPQALLIP